MGPDRLPFAKEVIGRLGGWNSWAGVGLKSIMKMKKDQPMKRMKIVRIVLVNIRFLFKFRDRVLVG